MNTTEFTLPAYWASAIINGDWSGLDTEDCADLRNWIQTHADLTCLDVVDAGYGKSDWGDWGDVANYTFTEE